MSINYSGVWKKIVLYIFSSLWQVSQQADFDTDVSKEGSTFIKDFLKLLVHVWLYLSNSEMLQSQFSRQ